MLDAAEMVAQQRAAKATQFILLDRECLTTAEIAERLGVTRCGAWRMMMRLAAVLPIYLGDEGTWQAVSLD